MSVKHKWKIRCKDCRFWSQRMAQGNGSGILKSLCLQRSGTKMMPEMGWCRHARPNTHGAIDEGERVRTHYWLTEGPTGIGQDTSTD